MPIRIPLAPLLLAAALALGGAATARAQAFGDVSEVLRIEVLPGWREAGGTHVAGLRFHLRPGWKTYWRSAGSLGISPAFDWRGAENLAGIAPRWPAPKVFAGPGGRSVGYDEGFVLPLVVRPRDAGAPVRLRGRVDLGVCADICVPASVRIDAALPAAGARDGRIEAALARAPRREGSAQCRVRPHGRGVAIEAEIRAPAMGPREAVVIELDAPGLWVGDAAVRREGATLHAAAPVEAREGAALAVDRGAVRLTVIGPRGAVEIEGCGGAG
ncbi:protein-disulfide reductase DsbD domain-containing protein [Jannaschia sp. W003]|uniref:protein-disulfide reductase DsbD domain-containing protein n=1 Tax=Jannaschia sp. W003 TaxID=2867012 RepID=UPI0021A2A5CC|nr:protein-disulfide reductase DsbD domain-containing protein [Jannaschia sp. W003]UWQ22733.1 hypothetical protein K3554_06825 [Jannaschia sp. W003]